MARRVEWPEGARCALHNIIECEECMGRWLAEVEAERSAGLVQDGLFDVEEEA